MLSRIVDLFVVGGPVVALRVLLCERRCMWTGGSTHSAAMLKKVPFCLLWCFCRERNDRSFKNREKTLVELEFFFFTLYTCTIALVAS
jgi:hypothetical protein